MEGSGRAGGWEIRNAKNAQNGGIGVSLRISGAVLPKKSEISLGKLPSICQFQGGFFAILRLAISGEGCYNKGTLGAWYGCRAERLHAIRRKRFHPSRRNASPHFLSLSPFLRSDSFPLSRRPVSPGRASTRRFVPAEPRSMRCACGIGCRGAGGAKGTPPCGGVPFAVFRESGAGSAGGSGGYDTAAHYNIMYNRPGEKVSPGGKAAGQGFPSKA